MLQTKFSFPCSTILAEDFGTEAAAATFAAALPKFAKFAKPARPFLLLFGAGSSESVEAKAAAFAAPGSELISFVGFPGIPLLTDFIMVGATLPLVGALEVVQAVPVSASAVESLLNLFDAPGPRRSSDPQGMGDCAGPVPASARADAG